MSEQQPTPLVRVKEVVSVIVPKDPDRLYDAIHDARLEGYRKIEVRTASPEERAKSAEAGVDIPEEMPCAFITFFLTEDGDAAIMGGDVADGSN